MHGLPMRNELAVLCFLAGGIIPAPGMGVSEWSGLAEGFTTGDIRLLSVESRGTLSLREGRDLDWGLQVLHQEVEYRPNSPIDPFGMDTDLSDTNVEGNLALVMEKGRWEHRAALSGYSGFRSYTAMWIDEYYRQQYGNGGIPGVAYTEPDPYGVGLEWSSRYEWKPASAYITISAAYLRDRVAPGYEIEDLGTSFELVRGETRLQTWTAALTMESALNSISRTRHTLRITDTTSREIRWSWNGAYNLALGKRWIARTEGAFAKEDPRFEAWSISQALEYEFNERWAVSVTARYYEDTGQIEAANLVSSAAPALDTRSVFLTLRQSSPDGESGFSLSIGPYLTNYAPTGLGTERFAGLYRDRDWWWGRIAFSKTY